MCMFVSLAWKLLCFCDNHLTFCGAFVFDGGTEMGAKGWTVWCCSRDIVTRNAYDDIMRIYLS